MITADKIRKLAYLDTVKLEAALQKNYPKDRVLTSKFLGITNGGEFCYQIQYFDQYSESNVLGKVFVDLDVSDEPVAQY